MMRLCTICARGGSKGVSGKNQRLLLGKPLIAHSIAQARGSSLFTDIAVSSDSEAILDIARQHGATIVIRRPDELATDTASKLPAIQHCAAEAEKQSGHRYDIVVDLDATSPLRISEDIRGAVAVLEQRGVSNVITGTPARRSPYFNLVEVSDDGVARLSKQLVRPVVRRQDAPACYDMNASIYAWKRDALLACNSVFLEDTALFVMPEERSIDIDSELDFDFVEFLALKRGAL